MLKQVLEREGSQSTSGDVGKVSCMLDSPANSEGLEETDES
jgi:hypothetical protein